MTVSKRGRPSKLSPEVLGRLYSAIRQGSYLEDACFFAGIDYSTFRRWMIRGEEAESESGILAISPPWARPKYEPSKRRITWPNGAIATLYSGEEPDRFRGPQHEFAWIDELAAMKYPKETWNMLALGLRLGIARAVVTTTPRPIPILREIMAAPDTMTVRGTTYENLANLALGFAREVLARYEGTRLGRQELYADLLEGMPGPSEPARSRMRPGYAIARSLPGSSSEWTRRHRRRTQATQG